MKKSRRDTLDMTKGSPAEVLLAFAVPVILSNLFQQLYNMIEGRPVEKKMMEDCQERLKTVVHRMKQINEHNLELIEKALEMAQFELNLYQSMKSAPETANYNKAAYNDGSVIGTSRGTFDAKQ